MVDFNNEATIGTPAADVEKISVLQRRYDVIEAYETYKKGRFMGQSQNLSIVRARIISLFIELRAMLKRKMNEEKFAELEAVILNSSTTEKDLIGAFFYINDFLDEIKLTRLDTKKVYDKTDVEIENEEKDY